MNEGGGGSRYAQKCRGPAKKAMGHQGEGERGATERGGDRRAHETGR